MLYTLSKTVSNGHAAFDSAPCPGFMELHAEDGAPPGYADTSFWDKQNNTTNNKPCRNITDDFGDIISKKILLEAPTNPR